MKKIVFLMSIFVSCLSCLTTLAQSKVLISPRPSFVGITKNSSTYTKQTLTDNYSSFFVGLDNSKNISGRVYLEFNLAAIPPKADITSAILKLTTTGSDSNFNGSIIIKSSNTLANADESTWYSLKGLAGSPIISANFPNSGTSLNLTSEALKTLIKNSAGGIMCLSINNPDESKIIRFSGDILKLSLEIIHTGISAEESSTNTELLPIPSKIISGEEITLGYVNMPLVYDIKEWKYDHNQFTEVRRTKSTITLIPKPIIGSTRVFVTMVTYFYEQFFYYHRYTHTWEFPIYGAPMITTSEKVTCAGTSVIYDIANFTGEYSNITWQPGTNMTLNSVQGSYATYRSSGNGKGIVKAKVKWNGKEYNLENSDVWVGIPETPSGVSGFSNGKNFNLNSLYSLSAYESKGATEYIWTITDGGEIRKYDVNGNRNVEMYTSINVGWNQTKSFSLRVSARNKCGTSGERALTGYVTFSGPGGIDEFSLRSATIELEPEIKSVKVYNLSGVLVYSDNAVNGSFDIKSIVLNDGIYIIEKFDGENRTSEKVILKR